MNACVQPFSRSAVSAIALALIRRAPFHTVPNRPAPDRSCAAGCLRIRALRPARAGHTGRRTALSVPLRGTQKPEAKHPVTRRISTS